MDVIIVFRIMSIEWDPLATEKGYVSYMQNETKQNKKKNPLMYCLDVSQTYHYYIHFVLSLNFVFQVKHVGI